MTIKQGLFAVISAGLFSSLATAGTMGSSTLASRLHPLASLQGGYASMNAGGTAQRFAGTESDVFTYNNSGSAKNTGFIGGFLGIEHALPWIGYPGVFMQVGAEYNYFGKTGVSGINTVGVEPQTATLYNYNYTLQTQQVLGTLKLFATTYERFYPYGEVGLGAAFNQSSQYNPTTTQTGSINLTPLFNDQNKTQFSYSLGLGIDTKIGSTLRVGLGYRYSNFGASAFGNGQVVFQNYQSPVAFALGSSTSYANQLIARISYFV